MKTDSKDCHSLFRSYLSDLAFHDSLPKIGTKVAFVWQEAVYSDLGAVFFGP